MPDRGSFLPELRERYRAYEATVEELERRRKPGEGIFGMKGGPADNPCHDRFAEELRAAFADFSAERPDSAQIRAVLEYVFGEPLSYRGPQCAYWMLIAVQGLTTDLIAGLSPEDADAVAARFEADYPRWNRVPVQNELLKRLRGAGTGLSPASRFSLFGKNR